MLLRASSHESRGSMCVVGPRMSGGCWSVRLPSVAALVLGVGLVAGALPVQAQGGTRDWPLPAHMQGFDWQSQQTDAPATRRDGGARTRPRAVSPASGRVQKATPPQSPMEIPPLPLQAQRKTTPSAAGVPRPQPAFRQPPGGAEGSATLQAQASAQISTQPPARAAAPRPPARQQAQVQAQVQPQPAVPSSAPPAQVAPPQPAEPQPPPLEQPKAPLDETGVWLDDTGQGAVEVTRCNGGSRLCGHIVWLEKATDARGRPITDIYNPEARLKRRKICRLQVIGDVKLQGREWDNGWIYDPKVGKSYDVSIRLQSPNRLLVTGYLGVKWLSKSFVWKRAPDDLGRCDGETRASAASR